MQLYDPEYLPLSYLSQTAYCPRRVGLLLNEQLWVESADTAQGRLEHANVHNRRIERRGTSVKLYEYDVISGVLGVSGKCDLIEAEQDIKSGCIIPAVDFPVRLYPVEFKHGRLREEPEYNLQLCAQAMCLEEMYHTKIAQGAIFYIASHRRQTVDFDEKLRDDVSHTAALLHQIRDSLSVPQAGYSAKCKRCSLAELCMPGVQSSADAYCRQMIREAKEAERL